MKNMKVIIDRFEGSYAICEKNDKTMIDIKKINIPQNAQEGDILKIKGNSIIIDKNATKNRRENLEKLTKDLWK